MSTTAAASDSPPPAEASGGEFPWELPAPVSDIAVPELKRLIGEMYARREASESALSTAAQYLARTSVGVRGSLIDAEGFPRDGVDHFAVTAARRSLAMAKTDVERMTDTLGEMLGSLHARTSRPSGEVAQETVDRGPLGGVAHDLEVGDSGGGGGGGGGGSGDDGEVPRAVERRLAESERSAVAGDVAADDAEVDVEAETAQNAERRAAAAQRSLADARRSCRDAEAGLRLLEAEFVPAYSRPALFAVESVAAGDCPARQAGLRGGDHILAFGPLAGPGDCGLAEVAQLVGGSLGRAVRVVVRRPCGDESPSGAVEPSAPDSAASGGAPPVGRRRFQLAAVTLVPQRWSGNGVLGCVLTTEVH